MSQSYLRGGAEWALMVALVIGAGAIAQAQAAEDEPQGPVVQIGKADEGTTTPGVDQPGARGVEQPAAPKYWIGLGVGAISPDHALRAFVDIPESQGLLVATVAPESPAAKAGLKQHDILLRANDIELHDLHDLTDLVSTEGAKKGQIAIEVLRKSGRETVNVTPEDRPTVAQRPQFENDGGFGVLGHDGIPQELLQRFQGGGPIEFRQFGLGGPAIGDVPSGVSINVQKEGDKPVRITVKRGDETWEVTGDDEQSLKQLPEDLQPYVEGLLHGNSPARLFDGNRLGQDQMPEFGDGQLRERLERMEKQMEQMLERLNERPEASKNTEESK